MLFFLSTPEYTNIQSNTTKIKVHLKNGIAEVFDQHQDLLGTIDNNIVEIETNFENRLEKALFIVQDAIFIISTKGLDAEAEVKGTSIYVYAKRAKEIGSNFSFDEVSKQYERKNAELDKELDKVAATPLDKALNSRIFILQDEVTFLKKVLTIVKELKS